MKSLARQLWELLELGDYTAADQFLIENGFEPGSGS